MTLASRVYWLMRSGSRPYLVPAFNAATSARVDYRARERKKTWRTERGNRGALSYARYTRFFSLFVFSRCSRRKLGLITTRGRRDRPLGYLGNARNDAAIFRAEASSSDAAGSERRRRRRRSAARSNSDRVCAPEPRDWCVSDVNVSRRRLFPCAARVRKRRRPLPVV